MRESMLHELYFGNVSPCERERIHTHEYKVLTQKVDDIVKHFKNLLSPEEYKKFQEMQNTQARIDVIEELGLFEYAFCAGAMLMIDIFGYKGK